MKIRKARESDKDDISLLMSQLGYEASSDVILENLRIIAISITDEVIVAEDDGKVVGVISCHLTKLFHQDGYAGRITSLVLDKNFRGQKVGRQLVAKAEEFFLANHCLKSEVTSGDHRSVAHDFYRSCGYKEDERRFIKEFR
jgi:N-acetylglutamate synthase-like GNAT family acetyltransferase